MACRSGSTIDHRRARPAAVRLGLCLSLLSAACAAEGGLQPFLTSDQNPFIQIYQPPPPEGARLAEPGAWRFSLQLDLANNSIQQDNATEELVLDGESYRATLAAGYGLSGGLEAGVSVPLVLHRRGALDNFIEDWHDLFGLSNSKRTKFESNQLRYSYASNVASSQVTNPAEGIGDVRLTLAYPLTGSAHGGRDLVLRAGLKLPTGDAKKLLGSGSTDLALQLAAVDAGTLADWKATLFGSVGMLRLGGGDVLDAIRRDYIAIGTLGLARPLLGKASVKLQLDAHSSFYDSALSALGSNTVQLTVGGQIELAGGGAIDLGLVENLFTDTTPDLVFHLAWRTLL